MNVNGTSLGTGPKLTTRALAEANIRGYRNKEFAGLSYVQVGENAGMK